MIINLDCTIGHDDSICDYVTLYPSVNVSGNVKLEECVEQMHAIISAARNNPARNKQLIADMRSQLDALVKGE